MVICFSFNNKLFQSRLEKRFIEFEESNILTEDINRNYDILLTDFYFENDLKTIAIDTSLNAREIYTLCVSRYALNLNSSNSNFDNIISFSSIYGGAGVSSISLTFSRLLSLNGEDVIYITSLGNFDSNIYIRDNSSISFNKRKMEYMLEMNYDVNPLDYLIYDDYRVGILHLTNFKNIEKILNKINKKTRIVIDFGVDFNTNFKKNYLVLNSEDSRPNFTTSNNIILNKSSLKNGYSYNIPLDKGSFKKVNEKIEISLDGMFSKAIYKIIDS